VAGDDVTVHLGVDDDASGPIADVADAADRLDGTTATVGVDADTADAAEGLDEVRRGADEVDGTTVTARADLDISGFKDGLDTAQGDLKRFGREAGKASRAFDRLGEGSRTSGSRISDLTGTLGDASSTASEVGGIFDGLGDIVEDMGGKFLLSEGSAASLAGAIGLAGLAVSAGAAVFSLLRQNQSRAADETRKMTDAFDKMNDAVRRQEFADAARDLGSLIDKGKDGRAGLDDLADAARRGGVSLHDATQFVTGYADALPDLDQRIAAVSAQLDAMGDAERRGEPVTRAQGDAVAAQREALVEARNALIGYRDDVAAAGGTSATAAGQVSAVADALAGVGTVADPVQFMVDDLGNTIADTGDDADGAAWNIAHLTRVIQGLKGQLDEEASFLSVAEAINNAEDAAKDAADAIHKYGRDSEQAQRAGLKLRQSQVEIRQAFLDVAAAIGGVPPEVQTTFDAQVNAGDLKAAKQTLDNVALARYADLKARADDKAAADTKRRLDELARRRDPLFFAQPDVPAAVRTKAYLDAVARQREAAIRANPTNVTATDDGLDKVATNNGRGRQADYTTAVDPGSKARTDAELDGVARDRAVVFHPVGGDPLARGGQSLDTGARAAVGAEPVTAPGPGRVGATAAVGAFPIYGPAGGGGTIVVNVDARGAVDPYAVGRQVSQVLGEWHRVGGRWAPGAIR